MFLQKFLGKLARLGAAAIQLSCCKYQDTLLIIRRYDIEDLLKHAKDVCFENIPLAHAATDLVYV